MRKYEFVVVLRASLKDADRKKLLDSVKSWLKDIKLAKENDWGQKPLAYTIKKESAGHYFQWMLEGEAGIPTDFEQKVKNSENILRHLLLRTK